VARISAAVGILADMRLEKGARIMAGGAVGGKNDE